MNDKTLQIRADSALYEPRELIPMIRVEVCVSPNVLLTSLEEYRKVWERSFQHALETDVLPYYESEGPGRFRAEVVAETKKQMSVSEGS
jgi:hypothetical protein